MHENLRSTISLKTEHNMPGNDSLWQTLIPAYEYGTFFVIYAKFRGTYVQGEPKKFVLDKADFYLQNYQGLITMGLVNVEPEIDLVYDPAICSCVYLLKINVIALEARFEIENQKLSLKEPPSIITYDPDSPCITQNNQLNLDIPVRVAIQYQELGASYFDSSQPSRSRLINAIEYQRDGDQLLKKKFEIENPTNCDDSISTSKRASSILRVVNGVLQDYKCYPTYAQLV